MKQPDKQEMASSLSGKKRAEAAGCVTVVNDVFRLGGAGITPPQLIYRVEPEYTDAARKSKRPVGLGLDEKAPEAVLQWKFRPGKKDGRPVAVAATIEITFRLL